MSIPSNFSSLHKMLYALNVNDNILLNKLSAFYDEFGEFLVDNEISISKLCCSISSSTISSVITEISGKLSGNSNIDLDYLSGVVSSLQLSATTANNDISFLSTTIGNLSTSIIDYTNNVSAAISGAASGYADELNTAMDSRVDALEAISGQASELSGEIYNENGLKDILSAAISANTTNISLNDSDIANISASLSGWSIGSDDINTKINSVISTTSSTLSTILVGDAETYKTFGAVEDQLSAIDNYISGDNSLQSKIISNDVDISVINDKLSGITGTVTSYVDTKVAGAFGSALTGTNTATAPLSIGIDGQNISAAFAYGNTLTVVDNKLETALNLSAIQSANGKAIEFALVDENGNTIGNSINIATESILSTATYSKATGNEGSDIVEGDDILTLVFKTGDNISTTVVNMKDLINYNELTGHVATEVSNLSTQIFGEDKLSSEFRTDINIVSGNVTNLSTSVNNINVNVYLISSVLSGYDTALAVSSAISGLNNRIDDIVNDTATNTNISFISSVLSGYDTALAVSSTISSIVSDVNELSTNLSSLYDYTHGVDILSGDANKLATEKAVSTYVESKISTISQSTSEQSIITGYYHIISFDEETGYVTSSDFYSDRTEIYETIETIESTSSLLYDGLPSSITIESNNKYLNGEYTCISAVCNVSYLSGDQFNGSSYSGKQYIWIKNSNYDSYENDDISSYIALFPYSASMGLNNGYMLNILSLSGIQRNTIDENNIFNYILSGGCIKMKPNSEIDFSVTGVAKMNLSSFFNCVDISGNAITNSYNDDKKLSGLMSGETLYLSSTTLFEFDIENSDKSTLSSLNIFNHLYNSSPDDTYIKYYPGSVAIDESIGSSDSDYVYYNDKALPKNDKAIYINVNDTNHIGSYVFLSGLNRYKCIYEEVRNTIIKPSVATLNNESVSEAGLTTYDNLLDAIVDLNRQLTDLDGSDNTDN